MQSLQHASREDLIHEVAQQRVHHLVAEVWSAARTTEAGRVVLQCSFALETQCNKRRRTREPEARRVREPEANQLLRLLSEKGSAEAEIISIIENTPVGALRVLQSRRPLCAGPLYWAARNSYAAAVASLLAKSVHPDSMDLHFKRTALWEASTTGNPSIMTALLEARADPSLAPSQGPSRT